MHTRRRTFSKHLIASICYKWYTIIIIIIVINDVVNSYPYFLYILLTSFHIPTLLHYIPLLLHHDHGFSASYELELLLSDRRKSTSIYVSVFLQVNHSLLYTFPWRNVSMFVHLFNCTYWNTFFSAKTAKCILLLHYTIYPYKTTPLMPFLLWSSTLRILYTKHSPSNPHQPCEVIIYTSTSTS